MFEPNNYKTRWESNFMYLGPLLLKICIISLKPWFLTLTGILVQLPLPKHINEEKVLTEISIEKDVDGFHPLNIGKLAMKGREPVFLPCTPKARHLIWEVTDMFTSNLIIFSMFYKTSNSCCSEIIHTNVIWRNPQPCK